MVRLRGIDIHLERRGEGPACCSSTDPATPSTDVLPEILDFLDAGVSAA